MLTAWNVCDSVPPGPGAGETAGSCSSALGGLCTPDPRLPPSGGPAGLWSPLTPLFPVKLGAAPPEPGKGAAASAEPGAPGGRAAVTVMGRRQASPGTCLPWAADPPTIPAAPETPGVASGSPQRSLCFTWVVEVMGRRQGSASTKASVGR